MVFDPLGSVNYGDMQDTPNQVRHHRKVTGLWSRRFRWAFCWLKKDEHGKEAFQQVAGEKLNDTYIKKNPSASTQPRQGEERKRLPLGNLLSNGDNIVLPEIVSVVTKR